MKRNSSMEISASVKALISSFSPDEPISADQVLRKLFELHPEYGGSGVKKIELHSTPSKKTIREWLEQIEQLFDWDKMRSESAYNQEDNEDERMEEDIPV